MCGLTCVVCDQLKKACTHTHRTDISKVFLHAHAHVQPHIANVPACMHLRNSSFENIDISEYTEFFLLPEIFRNSNFFDKMQFQEFYVLKMKISNF